MKNKFILEIGVIVLITNAICMHFLYKNLAYQDVLYYITECLGRLLIIWGIPFKSRLIKLGIATEVARLLYNIGWALGVNTIWSLNVEYFVPMVILISFIILDNGFDWVRNVIQTLRNMVNGFNAIIRDK